MPHDSDGVRATTYMYTDRNSPVENCKGTPLLFSMYEKQGYTEVEPTRYSEFLTDTRYYSVFVNEAYA